MSETKKPPAFFCPNCGQKHRAPIDELTENPEAVMRATCTKCGLGLALTLNADDSLNCRLMDEKAAAEADEQEDAEAQEVSDATAEEGLLQPTLKEAEFKKGDHVGRYAVEKPAGFGGTSTVYRAFDPTTNRNIALKVLIKDSDDTMRERFLREIEVQANIRHPNIMPVFDRGELPDGRPFFTMELLYKPFTLQDVVERREAGTLARYKTLEPFMELAELVATVMIPVSDGIYVANVENGVVHRDLKPGNVLVDSRTLRPYVIDFGICHVLERKPTLDSGTVVPTTTEDAGVVGTPRYLAPEQVKGNVHARTDVWGLGALLHFVISGEPPIAGGSNISRAELKRRIKALEEALATAQEKGDKRKIKLCEEKLSRLKDDSLRTIDDIFKDARDGNYDALPANTPASLAAVLKKAMAKSPGNRYVNARQFTGEVQAWLRGSRVRALDEAGGRQAAVASARRAVKHHTLTGIWIAAGLAAGLALGFLLARPGQAGPSTRLEDAGNDIKQLAAALPKLKHMADDERLAVVEQVHLWQVLDDRAGGIEKRLASEPNTRNVQSVRERVAFVRRRFAPPRFVLNVPKDVPVTASGIVPAGEVKVVHGENQLPPGKYVIDIGGGGVRVPVVVPLTIRDADAVSSESREPAFAVFTLPMHPDEIPNGMRLVTGATIRPRNLPFHEPTAEQDIPTFLMDLTEVTNFLYGQFLGTLPADQRGPLTPKTGFAPDSTPAPGSESQPVVGLRAEDVRAYAAWRSEQDGATYRLPTEGEWVLAAGASLGYALPNGAKGARDDGEFTAPLRAVGKNSHDVSPYGVLGLLGNAREMVTSLYDAEVLVKGAGVGDDPDQGALYVHRFLAPGASHPTTGFRLVREISAAE